MIIFFVDIKNIVNNDMWNSMIIQHKSDMIRSLLLVKFGGIWIDASVMCVQPLSKWMDYSKPFVTFVRNDQFMDKKYLYLLFSLILRAILLYKPKNRAKSNI